MKQARSFAPILLILFLIAFLAGLIWSSVRFSKLNTSGSGFLVQWIGIHSLFSNGDSPYSDTVSTKIQETNPQQAGFAAPITVKYNSPLFSGFIVLPFALIGDKTLAHALWLSLQLIALFAIILIGIRLTSWKPATHIFLLFSLITIFSYHVFIPWLDGSLSIWSTLFLAIALLALSQNRNEVSGIALAFSAIQPQLVILPILFILIWTVSQRRRLLILWFILTLVFLIVIGLFLVPDWIIVYLRLLFNFQQNFPPGSPGVLFQLTWPGLGRQLGWLFSAIIIIILLIEWWLALRREFRWFLWTVCLTMVVSQWIGIPTLPANLVLLLLPLILIAAMLSERWPVGGGWVVICACLLLFIWEWALLYSDISSNHPVLQLNLLIPLPLFLLIGLYWVRWWAIKPRRLLVEEIRFNASY